MIHHLDTFPGREIVLNGKKHLYFGGTSYLGLQTDREFQEIFTDNIKRYGTSYGASRKSNVRLSVFEKAETYLAQLAGSESCLTMSSGYLAAQLLVQSFNTSKYERFYAPHTHSALHLSKSKTYTTYASLNIALRSHLDAREKSTPVVLLDSIDFSGCNYPDFELLKQLPLERVILIVDDSHGIGIVGNNGSGVFKKLETFNPKELILCCSLGKAFGIQAGAVFGTGGRINSLMETDFFGGASPAAPSGLAALLASKKIISQKREKLMQNIHFFLDSLKQREAFLYMRDYPVFSFSDDKLSTHLEHNKIITTNFRYPSDGDTSKSRIVLGAQHEQQDLIELSTLIGTYYF